MIKTYFLFLRLKNDQEHTDNTMNQKLLNEMRKIVNKHDPIGIYFNKNVNFDEYDLEIIDIHNIFRKCKDVDAFTVEVYRIFKHLFSADVVGNKNKYTCLSKELFDVLNSISK